MWWTMKSLFESPKPNLEGSNYSRYPARVFENDRLLMKRIVDRIRWDQRISLSDLKISIRNGLVTLAGEVDSTFRRRAALELVGYTEGIRGFEDKIVVVPGFHRDDDDLTRIL